LCEEGYEPDGAGGCKLKEFIFEELKPLGSTQLSFKWEKQGATDSYDITCIGDSIIKVEPATCTTVTCYGTMTGLTPGTTYVCHIQANIPGEILNSTNNPLCSIHNQALCPLSATTDSVVGDFTIAPTCGQLKLSWRNLNVNEVTGYLYNIYKSTVGANDQGALLKQVTAADCPDGATTCELIDKEILPQVTYYYTIITEKDGEVSADSVKASAQSYCYEAPGWEER